MEQNFQINNGVLIKYTGDIRNVIIPEGVTGIADYAFSYCTTLQTVTIPESVTNIGKYAFSYCSALQTVAIPGSVTTVGNCAFYGCENLQSVTVSEGVKIIGYYAFRSCRNLQTVTLPDTVQIIDMGMFYDCRNLKSITLPKNLVSIENEAFAICLSLQSVTIPDSVTNIGDHAFWDCRSLQSITIPDSVKDIGKYAFDNCKNLQTVRIGNGVQKIPKEAFYGCPSLQTDENGFAIIKGFLYRYQGEHTHITVPDEVTEIMDHVFENLPNLVSITVPAHIKKLGKNFSHCPNLKGMHPNISSFMKTLPKKTAISDPALLQTVLSDYLWLSNRYRTTIAGEMSEIEMLSLPEKPEMPEIPAGFAEIIDSEILTAALEKQVKTSADYRQFGIVYARFASEASVENCVEEIRKNKKGQARLRYWAENMTSALYYSNTNAAREYIEKFGDFEKYVNMRGVSLQEYRDRQSLPDFGFDKNGVKTYTVDGKTLEVRIGSDFELILTDTQKGKVIRSISKKTEEGVAAAADYAVLKKQTKEFFKKRIEYIKKIYITAETISADIWHDIYLKNPLFRPITESLLWEDENKAVFTVQNGEIFDVNGNPYIPVGAMMIAHVLDMSEEMISAWRNDLRKKQKTLLIEQVWEPVLDTASFTDRYQNVILTKQERNELKKRLKSKGIEVRSEVLEKEFDPGSLGYVFSDNGTMLIGTHIRLDYKIKEDSIKLGKFSVIAPKTFSKREKNTIIFELDYAAIRSFIESEQVDKLTDVLLSSFTLPQILSLIDHSVSLGKTECTTILLNFKNAYFGNEDFWDLFILDF